ncbi:ABC transporter permease [Dokdonella sp.]|uniref:ABC transporter permease n=1 Tax=Dokdonella sp. TaxID=2291710 RepID=UPI002F427919
MEYFRFPDHRARLEGWVIVLAIGAAAAAAIGAARLAVRSAVSLSPAEAMRPASPARFRPLLLERIGLRNRLPPAMSMVLRQLERRPLRALSTVLGIAAALAIVVVGMFWRDALDYMIAVQFDMAQRADVEVTLVEPAASRMRHEIAALPGALRVEAARSAAVRLVVGHRSYRTALQGIPERGELRRLLDADLRIVALPSEGLLMTQRLARRLGVRVGEKVVVELLEGDRAMRQVQVAGTVQDPIGMSAYMNVGALNRLLREGDSSNLASVSVDRARADAFFAALRGLPRVATAASKRSMLDNFRATMARNVLVFTGILTAFALVIALGVVYNSARIALAERAWELASLRVLGFTSMEVSGLLLWELAIELALALPVGCTLGYGLSWLVVQLTHSDLIEIPVIVSARTYAFAAVAVVAAGVASASIVRRRVERLDLVGVLKTRE